MTHPINIEPHLCRETGPNHSVGILTFPNSAYYISRNENITRHGYSLIG